MCVDAWSTSDKIFARPTSPILATPSCDRRMFDVFKSLQQHIISSEELHHRGVLLHHSNRQTQADPKATGHDTHKSTQCDVACNRRSRIFVECICKLQASKPIDACLCTTPVECRKCRPRATSNMMPRPRLSQAKSSASSQLSACRRSPPCDASQFDWIRLPAPAAYGSFVSTWVQKQMRIWPIKLQSSN